MHSYNLANAPTHVLVCAAQVAQAKASNFAWTPPARPEAAPKQAAPLVPTHPPPLDLVSFAGLGNAPRPHESRASRRLEVHARCLRVAPILVHVCFCVSAGVAQAASAAAAIPVDDLNSCRAQATVGVLGGRWVPHALDPPPLARPRQELWSNRFRRHAGFALSAARAGSMRGADAKKWGRVRGYAQESYHAGAAPVLLSADRGGCG